jgi:dihydrofolate reductase
METVIIAAVAKNGVIGDKGRIPWHLPEDLEHFRRTTTGHAVIMGRKTYESIGKLLPGRLNIVLSKGMKATPDSPVKVLPSLEEALQHCRQNGCKKAFIIGGGSVYKEALERQLADALIITAVKQEYNGDTLFPEIRPEEWQEERRERHNGFDIVTYRRRASQGQHF